jgi:hypothetical protein
MTVLNEAEAATGISLMSALAENRFGQFLQGAIYAGLKDLAVAEVDGQPLTYDAIGEVCDFGEARDNYLAFMRAMAPEVETASKNPRGAGAKASPGKTKRQKRSPGKPSPDTDTDSSS